MKLSDFKGEKAIEVFADLLEPIAEILTDSEIVKLVQSEDVKQIEVIKKILKGHSKSVVQILAILEGEDPATYKPDIITLPKKLIEIFNDEAFIDLFTSQSQDA